MYGRDILATAILTSFNRNFKARNDGNRLTMNFLASPDIVTAMVSVCRRDGRAGY